MTIKKKYQKWLGFLLAGMMTVSGFSIPAATGKKNVSSETSIALTAKAAEGRLYNQSDRTKWSKKTYYYNGKGGTLSAAGCGLFSLANAIYALNGKQVNMDSLATWSSKFGYWQPGGAGTYREPFYKNVTSVFGAMYDFRVTGQYWSGVSSSTLKSALQSGSVAVAHVDGHFIALSGYNPDTSQFRVIESAVAQKRGLSAYGWATQSKLSSGYSKIDWFCLIERTNTEYFPRCASSFEGIVSALESVGAISSFAYRREIYICNGFTDTYLGTAEQNITMLNMLKQGILKKP